MPRRTKTLLQETYKCERCSFTRTINRKSKRKIGHIKHMMCHVCQNPKSKFVKVE